jgi:putative heme iron utilization protein
MAHEPRLMRSLRALLHHHRTAALATLQPAGDGTPATPFVSFVPYAIDTAHSQLVLHLSGLAAHTQQLQAQPLASLMVVQPESADARSMRWSAPRCRCAPAPRARQPRLGRRPQRLPGALSDVGFMMELGDFRLVCLAPLAARHIAGFGAARDVAHEELLQVLQAPPQPGD